MRAANTAEARARAAWGEPPLWVLALAAACDASDSSQAKVAGRIGYSKAVVSQVLKRSYNGSLNAVEVAVRGALMRHTVGCPVLGEILGSECLTQQRSEFDGANHLSVSLYRACRAGCPNACPQGGAA